MVTASSETAVNYDKQTIPFHIKIQALDYPSFSLEPYFEQVTDFIESQLQVTNVLVHCMAGISRSVSFTIAYLMKYKGLKFDEALSLIQSRRSIVIYSLTQANPNDGFVTQLKRYRKYLKSKGKIYKTKSRTSSLQVPQNPERVSRLRSPSPVIYNPEETKSLLRPSTKQDLVNQMYFMGSNPPINGSFYPQSRDFYSNTLPISDISNNPQRQNRLTSWSPVLTSYNYRAY